MAAQEPEKEPTAKILRAGLGGLVGTSEKDDVCGCAQAMNNTRESSRSHSDMKQDSAQLVGKQEETSWVDVWEESKAWCVDGKRRKDDSV